MVNTFLFKGPSKVIYFSAKSIINWNQKQYSRFLKYALIWLQLPAFVFAWV
jgi:hypothetical protein